MDERQGLAYSDFERQGGYTDFSVSRMKQQDDYISGPHHYWFQFVGGFVFGTALGAYLGFDEFENGVTILLVSLGAGLALASACGRWGETAWRYISEWFQTWWRVL